MARGSCSLRTKKYAQSFIGLATWCRREDAVVTIIDLEIEANRKKNEFQRFIP